MSSMCQEAATLTELHAAEDVDEVELVALVTEEIPRYRLRADSLTRLGGYPNQDWVQWPALPRGEDAEFDLSPEQIERTLDYFVICGARVSHMTRTYHDMEAVTRLLEEKEHDLELAAKIGQSLLEKNKELETRVEQLELELNIASEQCAQMKHELQLKDELLIIYKRDILADEQLNGDDLDGEGLSNEENGGSGNLNSAPDSLNASCNSEKRLPLSRLDVNHLERKIRELEEENSMLKAEQAKLQSQTERIEDDEQCLVKDCVKQLAEANSHIKHMSDELNKKTDLYIRQQEEITNLLAKTIDQDNRIKRLMTENEQLSTRVREAQTAQKALTAELSELHDKYDECLGLLDESHQEMKVLKKKSKQAARSGPGYMIAPYPGLMRGMVPGAPGGYWPGLAVSGHSLAEELQRSVLSEDDSTTERMSANLRALETVRTVKETAASSTCSEDCWDYQMDCESLDGHPPGTLQCPQASSRPRSLLSDKTEDTGYLGDLDVDSQCHSTNVETVGGVSLRSTGAAGATADAYLTGVPGSADLQAALTRLHREQEQRRRLVKYRYGSESSSDSTPTPCRTPDSIMSFGESPPSGSQLHHPQPIHPPTVSVSGPGLGLGPEKLRLVKPMEGSLTLGHWQRLAQPSLTGLFDSRPGIQVRGAVNASPDERSAVGGRGTPDANAAGGQDQPSLHLSDIEEDDDFCRIKIKSWDCASTFTFSTSRVLHPTDEYNANTQTTSSVPSGGRPRSSTGMTTHLTTSSPSMSTSGFMGSTSSGSVAASSMMSTDTSGSPRDSPSTPTNTDSTLNLNHGAPAVCTVCNSITSTFSMSKGLAAVLQERGIRCKTAEQLRSEILQPPAVMGTVGPSLPSPDLLPPRPSQIQNLTETVVRNLGLGSLFTDPEDMEEAPALAVPSMLHQVAMAAGRAAARATGLSQDPGPVTCAAGLNLFSASDTESCISESAMHSHQSSVTSSPAPRRRAIHRTDPASQQSSVTSSPALRRRMSGAIHRTDPAASQQSSAASTPALTRRVTSTVLRTDAPSLQTSIISTAARTKKLKEMKQQEMTD